MAEAPSKTKKHAPSAAPRSDGAPRVKQEPIDLESASGGPNILAAENFTHGGVRKAKFQPKVPTRRLKKPVAAKSEPGEGGEADLPSELMKLVKQSQEDANARSAKRADIRAPTRVAFGSGTSVAGRAASGFHRASSGAGGGGSGGGGGKGGGGQSDKKFKSLEGIIQDGMVLDDKDDVKKSLSQTWDLSKYYPVTLPLQKPGSIEPNAEDQAGELEEDAVPAADEFGLRQEIDEDKYIFFQLPSLLPYLNTALAMKGSESSSSKNASRTSRPDQNGPSTLLEDISPGHMGKLRVYKSGAVKLQLGGTSFEAVAGSQCVFAQELVGINAASQHCCFLGDVTDKIVLVPSLNDFLQNGSIDQQK